MVALKGVNSPRISQIMDARTINIGLDSKYLPLKLLWISPGQFKMSNSFIVSPSVSTKLTGEFEVIITRGYWLGMYAVTQSQWLSVMGTASSRFVGANKPITNIAWQEAMEFCDHLNSRAIERPDGYIFSLPTEAQWEYACKAGTEYKYQLGDTLDDLSRVAWHRENITDSGIQEIGQKAPNNWGFYDMLGNVEEWCLDLGFYYPDSTSHKDWLGLVKGAVRTTRGGNIFTNPPTAITCSLRGASEGHSLVGFRLCLRYDEEAAKAKKKISNND